MRILAILSGLIMSLGMAPAADIVGTVKSVDPAKSTITLADGQTYDVERVIDLSKFKTGEKVDLAVLGSGANAEVLDAKPAA